MGSQKYQTHPGEQSGTRDEEDKSRHQTQKKFFLTMTSALLFAILGIALVVKAVATSHSPTSSPSSSSSPPGGENATTSDPTETKMPNILIIQSDDAGPMLGDWGYDVPSPCASTDDVPATGHTPAIDSIKENGVTFRHFHTGSSTCGPSRFSTLTGRLPASSTYAQSQERRSTYARVAVPVTKMSPFDESDNIATALRAKGYTTGTTGKWHISDEGSSYQEDVAIVKQAGFDYADGIFMKNIEETVGADYTHNVEWVTEKSLEFMDNAIRAGKPFFLFTNPTPPHTPSIQEALLTADILKTPAGTLSSSPSFSSYCSTCAMESREETWSAVQDSTDDAFQRNKIAGMRWMDQGIGVLIQFLQEKQVLSDTIIIYFGDNGNAKKTVFDQGTRNAFFMRYDTLGLSGETDVAIASYDIPATLLEAVSGNAEPDGSLTTHGKSFLNLAKLQPSPAHAADDHAIYIQNEYDVAVIKQSLDSNGVPVTNFKLVHQPGGALINDDARVVFHDCYPHWGEEFQLYDMDNDKAEQSAVNNAPNTLENMKTLLDNYFSTVNISSPKPKPPRLLRKPSFVGH